MQQHLEWRVRDAIDAGLDEREARTAAARRFGGALQARERSRDAWGLTWLTDLGQDLRYGMRVLRRNPGFAAAAILSLALGIGGNAAIFSVLDALVFRPLPVSDPSRLVLFGSRPLMGFGFGRPGGERRIYTYRDYLDLRQRQRGFTGVLAASEAPGESTIHVDRGSNSPERATVALVSGNYFELLGVPAHVGRTFTAADDTTPGAHAVTVISSDYWNRRFSRDPGVVGRTILMGRAALVIVGVAAAPFAGDHVAGGTDFWVPLTMQAELMPNQAWLDDPMALWLRLVGRLQPGETIPRAMAGLNATFQQILVEREGSSVTPERRRELNKQRITLTSATAGVSVMRNRFAPSLHIVMGMVALVLLLACTNLATMMLARATARQKELGLRAALGAGRSRVLRQLLTESLLISVLGALAGLLLARAGASLLLRMASGGPEPVPLTLPLDTRMLAFTAVVALASALLVGLVPSLAAARSDPMASIRGEVGARSGGRIRLPARRLLVSAQVAMTLVLLVAAGLLVTTLRNLIDGDLGFDRHVLQVEVDGVSAGYTDARLLDLAQRLTTSMRDLRGVAGVSVSDNGLLSDDESTAPVMVLGDRARSADERLANFDLVSEGYFRTLGVPVVAGREFTEGDRSRAPRVAVINELMARYYFGETSAIGRQFRVGDDASAPVLTVVGVVKDIKNNGPRETPDRRFYVSYYQAEGLTPGLRFQLRLSRRPEVVAPMVRAAIRQIDTTLDITSMDTVEATYRRLLVRDRLMANLGVAFGVLAALLAATGLYGVLAYTVARRAREIGIRMALGARRAEIARLVVRDGALMVLVGAVIGLPAALLAARGMAASLFGLTPFDPAVVGTAVLVLLAVATCAAYLPARHATRVDPLVALRSE